MDYMLTEIQKEAAMVGYAEMVKIHLNAGSCSSSDSCESVVLDENYYKNQPPPVNYESIKEDVIKIDNKQCIIRSKKECDEEGDNRIEIQPPRYGKLNNHKSPNDRTPSRNQHSRTVERTNQYNRPGSRPMSNSNGYGRNRLPQNNLSRTRQPELSSCGLEFRNGAEEPIETQTTDDLCTRILSCLCNVCFC